MLLDRTFDLLRRSVEEGLVPGAAAAVGTKDGTLRAEAFGAAQLTPRKRALSIDMLFDCASLTKVVVTTTLALQAIEEGVLFLNQKVASALPEFGASGKGDVTVRHLLTHTSGLPAWIDLSAIGKTRPGALRAVFESPLSYPTGTDVVYSDLGFITLGELLSRTLGAPLERLARKRIFEPLAMSVARYRPTEAARKRCVTTEVDQTRGAITGEVHDENCATLGGIAGHAGLFAPLADLERYCRMWLNAGQLEGQRVLSRAAVEAATRDQTMGADPLARRGLGWVLQPNGYWPAADLVSPAAFSHTGFTGTSLLVDPERGLYAVLLTNRVHPTRGGDSADRIRTVRARFHNAAWSELS
jgi:CubicO group peptidase (beta-lactamase class C family)